MISFGFVVVHTMLISKWWWRSILWKNFTCHHQWFNANHQKLVSRNHMTSQIQPILVQPLFQAAGSCPPWTSCRGTSFCSTSLSPRAWGRSSLGAESMGNQRAFVMFGKFLSDVESISMCLVAKKKSPWHTIFSIARWFIQLLAKSLSVLGWLHHPTAWWFVSQAYGMGIGQNWQTNSYTTGSQTGRSSWWQKMWHLWSNLYGLLSLSMIRSDLSILIIYDYDICVYILYFVATQIWTCQERCLASHHHLLSMTMLRKIWRLTPLANVSTTSSEAALGAPI